MASTVSKDRLLASICEESFYEFVQTMWDSAVSNTPQFNWHIKYLCDEIQYLMEFVFAGKPKPYDLIINIAPNTTKSTICSVMLPVWAWTRMPHAQFICASYTEGLAFDLSRRSRALLQSEMFRRLWPHIALSDQEAVGHFSLVTRGWRRSVGVQGNITGFHAHVAIIDDPLNPQAAGSTTASDLNKVNAWMQETLPSRKVDKAAHPTILIMQRLHVNDPTGAWLARAATSEYVNVKHICLPAEICSGAAPVTPPELSQYYVDGIMDPLRNGRNILREQESQLGTYGYTGQYLQSPVPRTGGMFHTDEIRIEKDAPIEFKRMCRYWDKASTKDAGCYTAGVLMGVDKDGRYWVLHVVRGQWDANKREAIIKQTATADNTRWRRVHTRVEEEPGGAGKESAQSTIRNLSGFSVSADKVTGNKLDRADPYAAQVNGGNVFLLDGVWNADYLEELRHAGPSAMYMDQVDASSGAFAYLNKPRKAGPLW